MESCNNNKAHPSLLAIGLKRRVSRIEFLKYCRYTQKELAYHVGFNSFRTGIAFSVERIINSGSKAPKPYLILTLR